MNDTPDASPASPNKDTFLGRGGLWVAAQFPLGGTALVASMVGPELPAALREPGRWLGGALFVLGSLLALAGLGGLGRQLTPFPKPSPGATLVQSGAYGLARHPVYGGMLVALLGWALLHGRWSGLLSTLVVGLFFDRKASREEVFLAAAFPEYPAYRQRVSKLIPWLY